MPSRLQRVDEEHEAAGEPLLHIHRDERLVVDPSRKRECPRCAGVKLHRHFFSAKRRVEVDQCPNCGGYWLDAGELALIRAERTQGRDCRARSASPAFPRTSFVISTACKPRTEDRSAGHGMVLRQGWNLSRPLKSTRRRAALEQFSTDITA